jgi:hypothetical protein
MTRLENEKMFDAPQEKQKTIKMLAEAIVLTEERIADWEKQAADMRQALIDLMQQTGQASVTLDSGLAPKLEIKQRISKKQDAANETIFDWLKDNGLGDIIKPAVHPGTLQTSLEMFIAGGGQLPETLFSQYEQPSIRMNGRSKFLATHAIKWKD